MVLRFLDEEQPQSLPGLPQACGVCWVGVFSSRRGTSSSIMLKSSLCESLGKGTHTSIHYSSKVHLFRIFTVVV